MSIAFPCENCGHRFEVEASLAGKKGKCNKCGHKFVIPAPRQAAGADPKAVKSFGTAASPAASTSSSTAAPARKSPAKPAASAPDPYYRDDDPYGFDEAPLPPRAAGPAREEVLPARAANPVSFKPGTKKKKTSGDFSVATVPGWAYLVLAAVLVGIIIGGFAMKAEASVIRVVLPLCWGLMAVGIVGMLTVPFRESVVCGLLYIFLPFYGLYYLVTRWERDYLKNWFLLYFSGMAPMIAIGLFMPAFAAAHLAADRANGRDPVSQPRIMAPSIQFDNRPEFLPRGMPVPPPMPTNMPDQVTLNVSGLTDQETREAFYQKLGELSRRFNGGNGGRQSAGRGSNDVCALWPIKDVQGFAAGITFARVTNVSGRTIAVTMEPLPPGERRPPDSDFVAQALFDLKSPNRGNDALERLKKAPVDSSRREEVSRAIETKLKAPEAYTRKEAVEALKVWGGPENTPALIETLNDPRGFVVNAVLELMRTHHDPASILAVAAQFGEGTSRATARDTLKAIGPDAQTAVVAYLTHPNAFIRMEACEVLAEIGTTDETRLAVMDVWRRANGRGLDAMAAEETIRKIGKPQASPFKKKEAGPGPSSSPSPSPFKRKSVVPR